MLLFFHPSESYSYSSRNCPYRCRQRRLYPSSSVLKWAMHEVISRVLVPFPLAQFQISTMERGHTDRSCISYVLNLENRQVALPNVNNIRIIVKPAPYLVSPFSRTGQPEKGNSLSKDQPYSSLLSYYHPQTSPISLSSCPPSVLTYHYRVQPE
jgi:hypothetical protein